MTNYVFVFRGTGETLGQNMLMGNGGVPGLVQHLDRDKWEVREIDWPATYGPVGGKWDSHSYNQNIATGLYLAREALNSVSRTDDAVVFAGYSAGATVAHEAALRHSLHPCVVGAALVADPWTPQTVAGWGYWGIAGHGQTSGDIHMAWAVDPADPIARLDRDSPLRLVADGSAAMSFAPGQFPIEWARDISTKLITRKFQEIHTPWQDPSAVIRQYDQAFKDLDRYLLRGDHTGYGVRNEGKTGRTYLHNLALKINEWGKWL